MKPHRLTLQEARRIAVHTQLLDAPRPHDLLAVVRQLTFVQVEPTAPIAPTADLVMWSRLGNVYREGELLETVQGADSLFELNLMVRKVDATTDREAGVLRVHAIHEDQPFTAATADAVEGELDALAAWLRLLRPLPSPSGRPV